MIWALGALWEGVFAESAGVAFKRPPVLILSTCNYWIYCGFDFRSKDTCFLNEWGWHRVFMGFLGFIINKSRVLQYRNSNKTYAVVLFLNNSDNSVVVVNRGA